MRLFCWVWACLFALPAVAQDDSERELAYWHKHPAEWKAYKEGIFQKQQDQARRLDSVQAKKNLRLKLQLAYDDLLDKLDRADSLKTAYEGQKHIFLRAKKRLTREGLVFKIQIQVAKYHILDNFVGENTSLTIEEAGKDKKRYLIGAFDNYEEAQALVEVLRNGGASVYIAAYRYGKRLSDFSKYLD